MSPFVNVLNICLEKHLHIGNLKLGQVKLFQKSARPYVYTDRVKASS